MAIQNRNGYPTDALQQLLTGVWDTLDEVTPPPINAKLP